MKRTPNVQAHLRRDAVLFAADSARRAMQGEAIEHPELLAASIRTVIADKQSAFEFAALTLKALNAAAAAQLQRSAVTTR